MGLLNWKKKPKIEKHEKFGKIRDRVVIKIFDGGVTYDWKHLRGKKCRHWVVGAIESVKGNIVETGYVKE